MFNIPILITTFNRLDLFERQIKMLRNINPSVLYISSDGPREDRVNELECIGKIREGVYEYIDWDCEVHTLFHPNNLGCKYAMHEAIQWFFSEEAYGIVLEDDIIPSLSFFKFCESSLKKFKECKEVATICGRNELGNFEACKADFLYSSKFFCWGWASWADRILGLDVNISSDLPTKKWILMTLDGPEKYLVKGMYGLLESSQANSWAYEYDINFRARNQLQILPKKNLIKNVGLSIPGTHSSGRSDDFVKRHEDFFINPGQNVKAIKDRLFIEMYIRSRYKSFLRLYFFSKIKYLKTFRTLFKKYFLR
jgi:hypothetical protein